MAEKFELKIISEKQKAELEVLLNTLKSIRGRHTELVTVYIPSGFNKDQIVRQLEYEKSTAANIKSKATRTAVETALESLTRELKNIKLTPPNGLACFSGNVSEKEGSQDIKTWLYEPPKALNIRLYRCDQVFITEYLEELLSTSEVYALLVMDRREATIGILDGKKIEIIRSLQSNVPGKIRAGGQCLSPDTLIMKDNGEIIEIKESHNPLVVVSQNFNIEKTEETPIIAKWENNKELFRISTCYPKIEIEASKDHTFFIRTEKGIEEKSLSEIKEGDYLLMPEKINLNLQEQIIEFKPEIKRSWNMKEVKIPVKLEQELARIFGYYLGDGNYEIDRIAFSEQREEVANYYKYLIESYLGVDARIRFRENKGYYQIRVGSRIISQLFKQVFGSESKTLTCKIPQIVLRSPDNVLASFIAGFFDAEGYVSSSRVAAGFNNKILAKQLQFVLLRLGIISSVLEYDNRRNPYSKKPRHTVEISDIESIKKFREMANFASKEKRDLLNKLIENRSNVNKVRQIVVNGKEVARIIRNSGLTTTQFNCPDFFVNNRQMSKEIFKKNILDKVQNLELKRRLELFYQSNLIAAKIDKIEPTGIKQTVDIETKSHNFIANGLIVHNSAARYERITEDLAKEFFKKVAEAMKEIFQDMPKLKGILVGGPIPTKEEFLEYGDLYSPLKNKVIAIKDIGYTDDHGLRLLVEASHEDIINQELVKEKQLVQKFFETLGKQKDRATYGVEKIKLAIERGAVDKLLISKKLPREDAEQLESLATNIGSEIQIISTDTEEGMQFLNLTKGAGAILRFSF